jgi:glycosyltransferase involved in cell wall biosynthesis
MFSIVILTLNEEKALPECLASVAFSNDVVVLDSGSTDRTLEIASLFNVRVFSRKFDTFAGQRNFAQHSIPFKNPWVFHLDADERMTPELIAECEMVLIEAKVDGFRVAPRMMFEGRWIRHCTDYPAYQARFVRAPRFEFIQVGHGQREAQAMVLENLSAGYLHDLSIYGTESWLEKHRRYARDEANAVFSDSSAIGLKELVSRNALTRRRALKRLSFRLPLRPALRFVYQYGLRRGFLDGIEGFRYCRLLASYEGFVGIEIRKLRQKL